MPFGRALGSAELNEPRARSLALNSVRGVLPIFPWLPRCNKANGSARHDAENRLRRTPPHGGSRDQRGEKNHAANRAAAKKNSPPKMVAPVHAVMKEAATSLSSAPLSQAPAQRFGAARPRFPHCHTAPTSITIAVPHAT